MLWSCLYIDYYLDQRQVENFREIEKKEKKIVAKSNKGPSNSNERNLKKKISNVESKISRLEKEISIIDNNLLNNYEKTISSPNFFINYEKKKADLDLLMKKWENLNLS